MCKIATRFFAIEHFCSKSVANRDLQRIFMGLQQKNPLQNCDFLVVIRLEITRVGKFSTSWSLTKLPEFGTHAKLSLRGPSLILGPSSFDHQKVEKFFFFSLSLSPHFSPLSDFFLPRSFLFAFSSLFLSLLVSSLSFFLFSFSFLVLSH